MSTQPRHCLTIVEAPQLPVKNSGAKASRAASVGKKSTVAKKTSTPKGKAKLVARSSKSAALAKSTRRQPARRKTRTEMVSQPVLPVELEVIPQLMEQTEPAFTLMTEALPSVTVLAFPEETPTHQEFSAVNIETEVDVAPELATPECTTAEMEVIAETQLTLASETTRSSEAPVADVLQVEPENIRRTFAFQWNAFLQVLASGWNWLQRRLKTQQAKKRLRVCETVSLGEKRFIAVVQVDGEQFLVGGSSSSVSTLAHLEQPREFSDVFKRYEQSGSQA
jgi:flagellar biogenesis protein FliO